MLESGFALSTRIERAFEKVKVHFFEALYIGTRRQNT